VVGGRAAGRAAEGIIAKAVKDLFRVATRDVERDAARQAARQAGRDAARQAARRGEQRGARSFLKKLFRGDPVDVATGEVAQRVVDLELPGLLPLVLTRTHLSSYRLGRVFGPSWASTLDQRLSVSAAQVRLVAEDGSVLTYPRSADGTFSPLAEWGPRLGLAETGEGFTVTDPERGRTLHFAQLLGADGPQWPLLAVTDRNGNRIDLDRGRAGELTAIRHSGGYHLDVRTAGGRVVALSLRGAGALLRYGYDEAGNLAEVVDDGGRPTRYEYDAEHRLTRWTDTNGSWYAYAYDELGRCVRGENPAGCLNRTFAYGEQATTVTDSLGNTTTYQFNQAGQVSRQTDPMGNTTWYRWDDLDRLLARVDPLGHPTRYEYDPAGNLIRVGFPDGHTASVTYNDLGLPVVLVDRDGTVWRQEYDERGNLVASTNPAGATTRCEYDRRGHPVAVTDALGNVRRLETNAAGLPTAVTEPGGGTTRYEHDPFGRVVAVTDPLGRTTRFGWTQAGRIVWRAPADGTVERWRYDGESNLVEHTDPAGRRTTYENTHFDQPAARTGPDGGRIRFGYDTELRPTAVTDPAGRSWRFEYDAAGRVVRETDVNGRVMGYAWDAAGRLVARTNGAGEVTTFVRDAVGNVVEQRGQTVTTFEYDPAGRLTRAVNPDAELTFERDELGRVLAETCNGAAVRSRYDPLGRRVHRSTPSGAVSSWEYEHGAAPVALHTAGQTIRFGYDLAGHEVARRLGDAALLTQTWDPEGRLRSQTVLVGDYSSPLQQRSYTYRGDGEPVRVQDLLTGTREYALDPAGRVAEVRGRDWTEQYGYDPSGTLTAASSPVSDAAGPREHDGTLLRRAGAVRYQHDGQGRVVIRQHARPSAKPATWRYTWDADDRLVAVVTPDGRTWRYRYDPLGRRIAKQLLGTDGGVAEQVSFAWDGLVPAEQSTSGRTTRWDFDPAGFRPLTQVDQDAVDERFYAIVTDLTGTPTELLDTSGAIAWQQHRTLWGVDLATWPGPVDCPLRFPGQYHDRETGDCYNLHRYYDPRAAGFHSADPLGLAAGHNPHSYVPNPVSWLDPLGTSGYSAHRLRNMPRSLDQITHGPGDCADAARRIQRSLGGGDIKKFIPSAGGRPVPNFGKYMGQPNEWLNHVVVLKEGRVYDAFTPKHGVPLDEWKRMWEYGDVLDFGF
jgi:RHS repeat-associated protein